MKILVFAALFLLSVPAVLRAQGRMPAHIAEQVERVYEEGKKSPSPRKLKRPRRDMAIIATANGFLPSRPVAFKGEEVRFFITSTTARPSCFFMRDKELFLSARRGKVAEGRAVFKQAGSYSFYCPNNKIRGKLTVIDPNPKKGERKIASEKEAGPWRPKDF